MRVLALEAATEGCSAALLLDDRILVRTLESGRGEAQQLLTLVSQILAEAGVSLTRLDGIAASIGPGAFTGVRISVAVAQGLAFGAGVAVVPVNTLEALAMQVLAGVAERAIACLDARMGEIYWGCFAADAIHGLNAMSPARVDPPQEVSVAVFGGQEVRGIGRGFSAYPQLAALEGVTVDPGAALASPNAREVARLGALRLAAGAGIDPAQLTPLYLRDKVAYTEAERAAR
jgi:tRNA threonylcarbamoyladenosine biosynthesis protein TsaB